MESEQGTNEQAEGASVIQERLNWKLASRDDAKVAQGLYAGEEIEEMHELSDAGLLDEFFVCLEEVGMLRVFEQMSLPGVKRVLEPTVQFVLLYFLKVLFGSESMNELPHVLFSDLALMELVGFNAQQCENGLTKRGDAQRKTKKKQGPITPQCLAENISKLKQEEMEALFNQMVQLLVGWGLLSGERAKVRERVVRHGHGKTASEERLRTELVGLEALTSYDSYGAAEQTQHAQRRDYEGQPINAVVVRRWDNRLPKPGGTVSLTNAPVSDPLTIFDTS